MRRLCILPALAGLLGTPVALSAATSATVERADGSRIVYHTERPARRGRQGAILVLQGSGCEPVRDNAAVKATALQLAPDRTLVTIEKDGVAPAGPPADLIEGCTTRYWRHNTLQQRVLDATHVIRRLRAERWWNRRLVVMGGSEGGAVAAMLAPLVPEIEAIVIRSSGIGVPVGELIRSAVPPPVANQLPEVLAEARANPSGDKRWGGASYRWWADAADITPAKMLLQTDAPVLLIHGTRDQFAPVATARATRDLLARAGKRNLIYREYEGYDHFMVDASGVDRHREVMSAAADWLRRR